MVLAFLHNWLIIFLLLTLSACSSGNRAQPYEIPSPALENAIDETSHDPLFENNEGIPNEWWTLFNDDQLSAFIETSFANYPTLQAAQAKILYASSIAARARAPLFPSLFFGADVAREKFSETGIIPFETPAQNPSPNLPKGAGVPLAVTGGQLGIPVYFTQYETELSLFYEFDFWNKNRNTLKAAIGEIRARIADEAFARLQLSISLAQTYFQLQTDYKRQEILQELIDSRNQYTALIQHRIQNNLDNTQTLRRAEISSAEASDQLLQIQSDIAILENQLKAYLAGNFDETIFNTQIAERPLPKVPLPRDLPLNLIAHRPDIISQLWLIESAGKQIEVAKAGFYPDFNITALYGYQTIHFNELFKWPSTFFNVDPAVSLPIFDGGRLIANLRGSEINYDLAIYEYNQRILNAVREVLDGIAVLRNTEKQLQEYQTIASRQEDLLQLNQLRISHHLDSGLDYWINYGNLLIARDHETLALGNTIQALLLLIKALGGGYDACYVEG